MGLEQEVEQQTEIETFTEWTCNRAGLFDRLLTLKKRMSLLDRMAKGDKFYVIQPIDEEKGKLEIVFERIPLLQALDNLAFHVYCDLRESRADGNEIGIDILDKHLREGRDYGKI